MRPSIVIENWLGCKQGDMVHRNIIDAYNEIKPLPSGFKMTYNAAWCATTISAAYHLCKLDFPYECSCARMIDKAKAMGVWVEDDKYVPEQDDCILYDWDDGTNYASTDNMGRPEHVGIVRKVENGKIHVYEGNMGTSHMCGTRLVPLNGRFIRGFIVPKKKIRIENNVQNKTEYIVKPGDTLGKIAKDFGTTVNKIAKDNNIKNVNVIKVGQKLVINK